jgi:hypothetical protein
MGVVKWNLFGNLHHHQDDDQVTSITSVSRTSRKSDSKRNTYACGETILTLLTEDRQRSKELKKTTPMIREAKGKHSNFPTKGSDGVQIIFSTRDHSDGR